MNIGWIGTGVMGRSMAGHLLAAGHSLTVYNRSASKAEALKQRGATVVDSPAAVAEASDIVFTMVGYPADVRQVILGDATYAGLLQGFRHRAAAAANESLRLVIDMTTSMPSLAVEIHDELKRHGIDSLDAPVSGGDIGAQNATLSIMVGGSQAAFERALPLFQTIGKTIVYQGPAGSGQHTKMVNQTLVASSMIGVCEALLYAEAAGLDATRMLQSVSSGAASSWALVNLAPRIIAGDYEPGFYVEHFIKDMRIALDEAARMKISLPGLSLVNQLYNAVAAQGHERSGTQALSIALRTLSARGR